MSSHYAISLSLLQVEKVLVVVPWNLIDVLVKIVNFEKVCHRKLALDQTFYEPVLPLLLLQLFLLGFCLLFYRLQLLNLYLTDTSSDVHVCKANSSLGWVSTKTLWESTGEFVSDGLTLWFCQLLDLDISFLDCLVGQIKLRLLIDQFLHDNWGHLFGGSVHLYLSWSSGSTMVPSFPLLLNSGLSEDVITFEIGLMVILHLLHLDLWSKHILEFSAVLVYLLLVRLLFLINFLHGLFRYILDVCVCQILLHFTSVARVGLTCTAISVALGILWPPAISIGVSLFSMLCMVD